jgi:hypothetical protein
MTLADLGKYLVNPLGKDRVQSDRLDRFFDKI